MMEWNTVSPKIIGYGKIALQANCPYQSDNYI